MKKVNVDIKFGEPRLEVFIPIYIGDKRIKDIHAVVKDGEYEVIKDDNKEDVLRKNKLVFSEDYITIEDTKTGSKIRINEKDETVPEFLKRNADFINSILKEIELVEERDKNRLFSLVSILSK